MPQLDFLTFGSQLFWLAITFSLLYVILLRSSLPTIREVLRNRQSVISSDLDKAEALRQEAQEAQDDYTSSFDAARAKANSTINKALEGVKSLAMQKHAELDQSLAQKMEETQKKVEESKKQIIKELEPVSVEVADAMVQKLLGTSIEKSLIKKAVKQAYANQEAGSR